MRAIRDAVVPNARSAQSDRVWGPGVDGRPRYRESAGTIISTFIIRVYLVPGVNRRRAAWTGVRLVVSGVLLWFVVSRIGLDALVRNVATLPVRYVGGAVALSVLNVAISAWKWQILIGIKDMSIPYATMFKYYYIGQFFNAFMPTAIGGDTARMYYAYTDLGAETDAVSSVVMERFTGLFVILLLGGGGAVAVRGQLPPLLSGLVVAGSALGLGLLAAILFTDLLRPLLARTMFVIGPYRIGERLERVYRSITDYRHAGRELLLVFGLSALFRLVLIVNNYLVSLGLGMDVSFVYFLVFIPLAELILFVPISIQGFGVRETTYVYLFGTIGAATGTALSLGVVMQLVLGVLNNLIGGGAYLVHLVQGLQD